MVKGVAEMIDVPKAVILVGPRNAMGLALAIPIIEALYSDFPDHWNITDCLNEPDWDDWQDFFTREYTEKRP